MTLWVLLQVFFVRDLCAHPATSPTGEPATPAIHGREAQTLSNLVQLTRGFERAGEAYFSPDMRWIIFEAVPHGQEHYQMYMAHLQYKDGWISGADEPIRISPEPSRNTCGFFSPDGKSLIFS